MNGECEIHNLQWYDGTIECPVCVLETAIEKARTTPDFIFKGRGLWTKYSGPERIAASSGAKAVLSAIDALLEKK